MTCCDTCPFTPDCEEVADFERDVLRMHDEWGEEYDDAPPDRPPAASPRH